MKRIFRPHLVLLVALVMATLIAPVFAQDDPSDDEVNEVARDIYCPVCENTPLDVCQTKACADWRELIRTKLSDGESKDDIFDYFARQYGDGVLADPPQRGISLVILWVLPLVVVLLGLLLFVRMMRGLRGAAVEAPSTAPEPHQDAPVTTSAAAQDDYMARIEEELDKKNE